MKVLNVLLILVVFMTSAFIQAQPAVSADIPEDYPWTFESPDGETIVTVNIATILVQQGVYAYYYAMGEWPESWNEVVEAGICQVPLLSPEGHGINPDDGNLDFMWDVTYLPPDGYYGVPKTVQLMDVNGPYHSFDPFEEVDSLEEKVGKMRPERAEQFSGLVDDVNWRKLAAIRKYCNRMLVYCPSQDDSWPESDEFLDSLWSPLNTASINPLTGEPFKFDGSPNDLAIIIVNGEGMPSVQITDENGEISLVFVP